MTVPYHGAFPTGYLLVLASGDDSVTSLDHVLDCACRSDKPAVWVDCRLVDALPDTAGWLLWACAQRLHRAGRGLAFCRVSAPVEQALRQRFAPADLRLVPTLADAEAMFGPPPPARPGGHAGRD